MRGEGRTGVYSAGAGGVDRPDLVPIVGGSATTRRRIAVPPALRDQQEKAARKARNAEKFALPIGLVSL